MITQTGRGQALVSKNSPHHLNKCSSVWLGHQATHYQQPSVICFKLATAQEGDWDPFLTSARQKEGQGTNLRPILRPRSCESRSLVESKEGLRMGQQAVSLKWKPGQDMKQTRPGREWTERQGAILLTGQLDEQEGCLSVYVCLCVSRITERRATCADRGLCWCHFLQAGVCVSQSGRSAAETAPAHTWIHALFTSYTCEDHHPIYHIIITTFMNSWTGVWLRANQFFLPSDPVSFSFYNLICLLWLLNIHMYFYIINSLIYW